MSRIRTIKPEFFTSADIVCMTPLSRLFYASLWCEADREGRLKWDLKTLKLRYFPADDCDLSSMANELLENGLIVIYEVNGKSFAEIPSFTTHQIINNREAESVIPARLGNPPSENASPGNPTSEKTDASFTRESGQKAVHACVVGREGKGREDASKRETTIPADFSISPQVAAWAAEHGHHSLDVHLSNFVDSCKAKGYKYRDWDAAFRGAISKNWAKVPAAVKPAPGTKSPKPGDKAIINGVELTYYAGLGYAL